MTREQKHIHDLQSQLSQIRFQVNQIWKSQGWLEALESEDTDNVTVWIGPRLHNIHDLTGYVNYGHNHS